MGESPHPHRLNVGEGADAVVGTFASVAAFLDAAQGQARIAYDHTASKTLRLTTWIINSLKGP